MGHTRLGSARSAESGLTTPRVWRVFLPSLSVLIIARLIGFVKHFFKNFFVLLFGQPFDLPPYKGLSFLRGFAVRSTNRKWDGTFYEVSYENSVDFPFLTFCTYYTIGFWDCQEVFKNFFQIILHWLLTLLEWLSSARRSHRLLTIIL